MNLSLIPLLQSFQARDSKPPFLSPGNLLSACRPALSPKPQHWTSCLEFLQAGADLTKRPPGSGLWGMIREEGGKARES